MKKLGFILLAISTLLTVSCTKHWDYDVEDIKYGFTSEIHDYSKEFILMKVNNDTTDIQLKGNIELYRGRVKIEVIQPGGDTVFEKDIADSTKLDLNETFPARGGYWTLKYSSTSGEGFIDLHLDQ